MLPTKGGSDPGAVAPRPRPAVLVAPLGLLRGLSDPHARPLARGDAPSPPLARSDGTPPRSGVLSVAGFHARYVAALCARAASGDGAAAAPSAAAFSSGAARSAGGAAYSDAPSRTAAPDGAAVPLALASPPAGAPPPADRLSVAGRIASGIRRARMPPGIRAAVRRLEAFEKEAAHRRGAARRGRGRGKRGRSPARDAAGTAADADASSREPSVAAGAAFPGPPPPAVGPFAAAFVSEPSLATLVARLPSVSNVLAAIYAAFDEPLSAVAGDADDPASPIAGLRSALFLDDTPIR